MRRYFSWWNYFRDRNSSDWGQLSCWPGNNVDNVPHPICHSLRHARTPLCYSEDVKCSLSLPPVPPSSSPSLTGCSGKIWRLFNISCGHTFSYFRKGSEVVVVAWLYNDFGLRFRFYVEGSPIITIGWRFTLLAKHHAVAIRMREVTL